MHHKSIYIVIAIVAILAIALFAYVAFAFRSIRAAPSAIPSTATPQLSILLVGMGQLWYNSALNLLPYSEISYKSSNITTIYVNSTLFEHPPPQNIYVLNVSGSCYNCAPLQSVITYLNQDLHSYDAIPNRSSLALVSMQNVTTIPDYSALVVLSGAMPLSFLSPYGNSTSPLIEQLLNKGIDIVYVGRNFSVAASGSVLVPVPASNIPPWMAYGGPENYSNTGFYLTHSQFYLRNGTTYGPVSYVNRFNGSLLVFPAYLTSWRNASDSAADIAKALSQLFWLPQYAHGSTELNVTATGASGIFGFVMPQTASNYTSSTAPYIPQAYAKILAYNNASYSLGKGSTYVSASYTLTPALNGTLSIPTRIIPGTQQSAFITVSTGSNSIVTERLHMVIYNLNMTEVQSLPLETFNASGNYTFIKPIYFELPPGSYVAEVRGFYNKIFGAALFNMTPINISLKNANFTSRTFLLGIASQRQPLIGINYTINLNGLYPYSGSLANGTILYVLPSGVSSPTGKIKFNINLLGRNFTYTTFNSPPTISGYSQYIELTVVIIIAAILIIVVKAPNRDEFYIDVPTMAIGQKKAPIKIKAAEMLSVFDKLNLHNHWRFMPLSVAEVKLAIASNIRHDGMAVSLTYSNVQRMLDEMVSAGQLVMVDGLYAPKSWISISGHDAEYLATFKKMREYLVSHAFPFNDLDLSDRADIVATMHNETVYMVIYSRTSKFQRVPIVDGIKTKLVFLNEQRMEEFQDYIHSATGVAAEQLRIYMSTGKLELINADNPETRPT
jgi:hypothetical protein